MASKNSTSNTQRGQNFGGCIILRWICLIWIKMFKETTCNQKQLRRPVSSNFYMKLNLRFTLKKSFLSEKNPKKSQWDLQKNPIWDWDFQNRKSHMGNPIVGYPMRNPYYRKNKSYSKSKNFRRKNILFLSLLCTGKTTLILRTSISGEKYQSQNSILVRETSKRSIEF